MTGPNVERRTAVERAVVVLVVAVALGAGAGVWLTGGDEPGPPEVGPLAAAIDWSSPAELPPAVREDFRSEFVGPDAGYRFWPRSGRVTPSVAYRFDAGHCGLSFLADFDGSFWRPIDPNGGRPPAFFHQNDVGVGAIALVDFDTAVYRSANGVEVSMARLSGPVVTEPCR